MNHCLYDIPNENITYCDDNYQPTPEQCQQNVIKMTVEQATDIRRNKGLSMPHVPTEIAYNQNGNAE